MDTSLDFFGRYLQAIMQTGGLEWAAAIATTVCIVLAGRNNVHTWWTGLVGVTLYAILFFDAKLYADVTLQVFFFVTGVIGWIAWVGGRSRVELPITGAGLSSMSWMIVLAIVTAVVYGSILHYFTDAYAPYVDSLVLTFSVLGQLLLMRRNWQTWPVWVLVNTLSVPLYFSRELYLTATMYSVFWVNACVSWWHWRQLMKQQ